MLPDDATDAELLDRSARYARALLERCRDDALQIHADEVGPEHLLSTLMDDEECAAHRVALHAFADPETISEEARALASGILISGSAAAMPFSASAVRALQRARRSAAGRHDSAVEVAHLLLASFDELEADLRATFEQAAWSAAGVEALISGAGSGAVPDGGHLFGAFSDDAKRTLSAAAKLARGGSPATISAAHLFLACLQSQTRFERAAGVPASRARIMLRGRMADLGRVAGGPLGLDRALRAFLAGLAPGADTLDLLARFHSGGTPELAQVLLRHRVTPPLLERCRGAFQDPEAADTEPA